MPAAYYGAFATPAAPPVGFPLNWIITPFQHDQVAASYSVVLDHLGAGFVWCSMAGNATALLAGYLRIWVDGDADADQVSFLSTIGHEGRLAGAFHPYSTRILIKAMSDGTRTLFVKGCYLEPPP